MRVEEGIVNIEAKMDVKCNKCKGMLKINASDITEGVKTFEIGYFKYRCKHCKKEGYIHKTLILDDVIDEYNKLG